MRRRGTWRLLLALTVTVGCRGYEAGRLDVTAPSVIRRPVDHLRAELSPGDSGEIVLDPSNGLSPDEAALMAVDQNPRLAAIRAERGIAGAELVSAGILPNPRLELNIEAPYGDAEQTVLSYGVGLAWDVAPMLSRGRRRASAKAAATSVDLEVAWQEWQFAQAARMAAVRVVYLERRVAVANNVEASWKDRVASLRTALAHKAVTDLDVAGAETSLAEARLARLDLEQELNLARVDLNAAIGLDPLAEVRVDAAWHTPDTRPAVARLLFDLPTRRLDVLALYYAYRSGDEALRADAIARFPPLDVGVHVGRDVDSVSAAGVTLTLDLPLFDRKQGELARDHARRDRAEAEYDARLYEARVQIVRITTQLDVIDDKLATATEARDTSRRLAELARSASVAGVLPSVIATNLEQRAFEAELRVVEIEQAQAELWVALTAVSG